MTSAEQHQFLKIGLGGQCFLRWLDACCTVILIPGLRFVEIQAKRPYDRRNRQRTKAFSRGYANRHGTCDP